jgi:hypothetical protein
MGWHYRDAEVPVSTSGQWTWPRGEVVSELALVAIDYVRDLNRSLAIAPMAGLIRHDDLDLLAEKAAPNPSRPRSPRSLKIGLPNDAGGGARDRKLTLARRDQTVRRA